MSSGNHLEFIFSSRQAGRPSFGCGPIVASLCPPKTTNGAATHTTALCNLLPWSGEIADPFSTTGAPQTALDGKPYVAV